MKNNEFKTPRWNLDSLYHSLDTEEYKNDIANLENIFIEIKNHLMNVSQDFSQWLKKYIDLDNQKTYLLKTLSAYAYIIYSTDTTHQEYMNNLNRMDDYDAESKQLFIQFSAILCDHKEQLNDFYTDCPDYKEYEYLLNEIIEEKKHQMSSKEEELASKMSHTGGNAWSLLQEQIISNLHDETGKTFNELRNDANDANPKLRKESWEKEIKLLEQNRIALAACLNNLKGETITLNTKRNWQEAIDRSLFSSRLSKKTLEALICAIEDSLPYWRKYLQAKAKILRASGATASPTAGTSTNPGIAFYDLFAPLVSTDKNEEKQSFLSKKWTYPEAAEYVINEYNWFSKSMGSFARNAVDNGWVDAEVHPGKVGGAYDEDFPKGHQSRVLTNFTGTFSDIITLAHELGHAYHFSCMKNKAPLFYNYPMTLAETASTFAETIVKQDMIKNSTGFDRIRILDLDLTDTCQVLVDILSRFYFEKAVFEARKTSELTADDFCNFMKEAQEKTYGCGLNEERHPYMWALKCHYYIPELDFYNFPYAFGQLFATGLYEQSKKAGPEFAETYEKLLSETGSMCCEDLCRKAGFDITTPDFWKSGIEMYIKEIEEFCNYKIN